MTKLNATLFSDRPDLTAALRQLAWAHHLKPRELSVLDIVAQINLARHEMGLHALQQGAPITLIQKRCIGFPQRDLSLPVHYQKLGRGRYEPVMQGLDWRFFAGHTHGEIRTVAREAAWLEAASAHDARLVARGSHLPDVRVWFLNEAPVPSRLEGQRGLYLVRYGPQSYVGQSDEIKVRWGQHRKAGATSGIFVYTETNDLTLEALNVAESLGIAAFKELLRLKNRTLGRDREPGRTEVLHGSAFALMFQAAVVRLAAEGQLDDVLVWRADRDVLGLRDRYLALSALPQAPAAPVTPAVATSLPAPGAVSGSVLIAAFGADGGTVTLHGEPQDGVWAFCLETDESALADMMPEEAGSPATLKSRYDAGRSWAEALEVLDRYPWARMHIVDVHPAFESIVRAASLERQGNPDRWNEWDRRRLVAVP